MPSITVETRNAFLAFMPKAKEQLKNYIDFVGNTTSLYNHALEYDDVVGHEAEWLGDDHADIISGLEEARRDSLVMLRVLATIDEKRLQRRRFDRKIRLYIELFNVYKTKVLIVDKQITLLISKLGDLEQQGAFDDI